MSYIPFLTTLSLLFFPASDHKTDMDKIFSSKPVDYNDIATRVARELKTEGAKVTLYSSPDCATTLTNNHQTKTESGCSTLMLNNVIMVATNHVVYTISLEEQKDGDDGDSNQFIVSDAQIAVHSDTKLAPAVAHSDLQGVCSYTDKVLSCEVMSGNFTFTVNETLKTSVEVL